MADIVGRTSSALAGELLGLDEAEAEGQRPAFARSDLTRDPVVSAAKPAAEMAFEERVEQTVKWLLTGSRDADVVEAIRAHWPGQELQPLVTAAMQQLIEAGETEAAAVRGWCFEATKSLYAQMVAIGDFAGALRAVKQLYELAGK